MINYGFNSQSMLNQLMRQKDNINDLISQYTQPQAPVQNIINTGSDFEARILKKDEQVDNILVNKRTMFLDEYNKKLYIKELDGTISKEYEVVIPLDEKDKKIIALENKLREMGVKIDEFTEPISTDNKQQKSLSNVNEQYESNSATNGKTILE